VVTRDVPDYALVVGVPARQKGWVCECGEILPKFEQAIACPRCGMKYALKEGRLKAEE
jgi:UDP-2-acetamido-3-amino-2,3-dideoxy-glucuronate N-acetyltransferase